jgi:hypothetical protein
METLVREPPPATQVFQCQYPDGGSPAKQALALVSLGAMVGAVAWFGYDRTLSISHIAGWLAAGIGVFTTLAWLVTRNPVLLIGIDDAGLKIVRARGTRTLAWADIEAARFQDYELPKSGGQTITCLLLRAAGENFELTPEFADDDAKREAFEEAILRELEFRDIPETSIGLPSFERTLSLAGAWLFVASIAGLLAAHAAGFHTLGTVFGLAFLFTGTGLAWMTRRLRTSRLVLAATAILILGGCAILWACQVNVREVLNRWEWVERGSSTSIDRP